MLTRFELSTSPIALLDYQVMFATTDQDGERLSAELTVKDTSNRIIFQEKTNDERFDANDHVSAKVKLNQIYRVE
jgi:hypothetical protein